MTVNEVEVVCPNCGHNKADIFGFYTISEFDQKSKQDIIKKYNDYKCLKCKTAFTKERTNDNLHLEHFGKK